MAARSVAGPKARRQSSDGAASPHPGLPLHLTAPASPRACRICATPASRPSHHATTTATITSVKGQPADTASCVNTAAPRMRPAPRAERAQGIRARARRSSRSRDTSRHPTASTQPLRVAPAAASAAAARDRPRALAEPEAHRRRAGRGWVRHEHERRGRRARAQPPGEHVEATRAGEKTPYWYSPASAPPFLTVATRAAAPARRSLARSRARRRLSASACRPGTRPTAPGRRRPGR